ncbi:hypothetical protein BJY00DRAFT_317526 [Aspergillus carlsbadensis]|nr:hypothetical protein BJY00DRAFT_317526 [Aspergillus carlsbadensis]
MRLLPLLCACVLSSATQSVAAKDSSTLPSIQISNELLTTSHLLSNPEFEVIAVSMTGLAISTLDSGVDHKGSTTYDCITYTTVVVHTHTRPRTSTMTTTHTELSEPEDFPTGSLGSGVTSVSDSGLSNTGGVGTSTENANSETGSETNDTPLPQSSAFSTFGSIASSPDPLASPTPTTNYDGHGSLVTTSNTPGFATNDPLPGAILTATTDGHGNIITVPNNPPPTTVAPRPSSVTTDDAEGNVITVSICSYLPSCLPEQILPSDVISSSLSAISSEFRNLLPTFSS